MNIPFYASGPSGVTPPPGRTLLDRLVHALLPAPCLECGEPLPARGTALGLCAVCRGRLKRLPEAACEICARPLPLHAPPPGFLCALCRESPPGFDRLLALWSYEPPLDKVVQALKFNRLDYLGSHLAQALADELEDDLAGFDGIVPVPLHWRRRLARGYNQAEWIARPLARSLGLPLIPALTRRRATPPQTRLGRQDRLANLRRAFRARHPERLRGRDLLLVDDVATTGATLDAAATALKKAGAATVTALVAGRTPLHF
ncbi:MAG TPA: ComF family protein [Thermoanaerobaculia bacterium]|nr:ComF family protein [Thermoanaerobaculia bacterium]